MLRKSVKRIRKTKRRNNKKSIKRIARRNRKTMGGQPKDDIPPAVTGRSFGKMIHEAREVWYKYQYPGEAPYYYNEATQESTWKEPTGNVDIQLWM